MNFVKIKTHRILIPIGMVLISFFIFTGPVFADSVGNTKSFFVNSDYDESGRTVLSATLREISDRAYFYVEDRYWARLNQFEKDSYLNNLKILADQFDDVIYPKETQNFGSEPNPGIDGDPRILILLEELKKGTGGYFDSANLVARKTLDSSNEREMVTINSESVGGFAKIFLAHEFQHLISSNQKETLRRVSEEIWLNELRSEYSNTLTGYNDVFRGSGLERRVSAFNENPSDSLVEWPNVSLDYAHVALFAEYLAEQFGPSVLTETIKFSSSGIESINQYFQSRGRPERFSEVFGNWLLANYLNNTNLDPRYGYKRSELKDIDINPRHYLLPYPGSYQLSYDLKPWQGSWHSLDLFYMPEGKAVKIDFNSEKGFKLWYADNLGNVGVLADGGYVINKGGLSRVVLMPVNESKVSGFGGTEEAVAFTASVDFVDPPAKAVLKNGDLVKRPRESEIYVIEGTYKRYLHPDVIKLYGHLDPATAVELDDETFNSYTTANYVRNVNEQKVYAVWPDGTKHWLNMSGQYFTESGRDWNSIFIINDLELNHYQTGIDITR